MIKTGFLLFILSFNLGLGYRLPVNVLERNSVNSLKLTKIGEFGLLRKERPKVPAHYHTGIDIKRPTNNYESEPIFPIFEGVVISKREDGPYAQLIIEHGDNHKFWTVYEHIAGIEVNLYDHVNIDTKIARFMNKRELNRYGWQFDHFHFEVLKVQPFKLKRNNLKLERLFSSYTLVAYTKEDLNKYFYDPLDFLEEHLN
ncbi:M23 family metallopeptidase [Tenacibaculum ovolyticum]|uniref:M23 family metallopeptidase n=1 Tax=Tenacibaculum ovolyticum TaxID=104270 RepID=UPI001F37A632|nr:M23 family metallopeptidase [Tenacibaculum ovolyticum]